jgi:hypothetical protein
MPAQIRDNDTAEPGKVRNLTLEKIAAHHDSMYEDDGLTAAFVYHMQRHAVCKRLKWHLDPPFGSISSYVRHRRL